MTQASGRRNGRSSGNRLLQGCAVAAGLFTAVTILSTGFGILVGVLHGLNAVGGGAVPPSQKARLLAEGISAAMNCTAFAFLLLIPVAVVIGVWMWRRQRRAAEGRGIGAPSA